MNKQKLQTNWHEIKIVWKWLRNGVRWLSIIVFGCLFFLGIYFKLPWKILVCLAIIPVVGLFFPRKVRTWIWLTLTLVLVSLFGWLHLPENSSSEWQPYQFRRDLNVLENKTAPDGPNAADLYKKVLDEYGETIFYFRFDDGQEQQTLMNPWNPVEHPRLDFWITALEPAMQTLIEAAAIDECRFDIPHNLPAIDPQLGRLNQFKGWARLLLRASGRDIYNERLDLALQKQLAVIGMARHLYQQTTLFDQSAAFQIEVWASRALESVIILDLTDAQAMARIEQAVAALNPQWPRSWPGILKREKLQSKNIMGLLYEKNDNGRVRFSHSAMIALQEGLGYKPRRLFVDQQLMNRLLVVGLWLWLPSDPHDLGELVERRFDHYSLEVQKGTRLPHYSLRYIWVLGLNIQSIVDWLAMQQVGYYWALDTQFLQHQAIIKQLSIFTALKRFRIEHNEWPPSLDDLGLTDEFATEDPLNRKTFIYERIGEGFRFYSLGPNGIDDNGVTNASREKDDILIWPRNPQAPEETPDPLP